ncbi:hypothetical protein ROA7450_03669 [Roseovarius albus]|uniref:Uncharacterized protein n=1 Tax=Roseovarius albus TaxID=1247867 RepID=A0A1X7A264_9RHOB|nr:hypothetical protein [Roseovarius albus]SLN68472.1 hypothetical protein ROA7450_03669 [Roseovarius albus]
MDDPQGLATLPSSEQDQEVVLPVSTNSDNMLLVAAVRAGTYFYDLEGMSGDETMVLEEAGGEELSIYLMGPLSVVDEGDQNLTPKNQKSKAALAMLALAPRGSRSRVWLRDKLWSDRSEEQASASLRQALLDIRKSLGPDHKDLLHADKYSVTLDLSKVHIDVLDIIDKIEKEGAEVTVNAQAISEHFLEGFDICDPEFEEWLTLERQIWDRRFSGLQSSDAMATAHDLQSDLIQFANLPHASPPAPEAAKANGSGFAFQSGSTRNWAIGLQVLDPTGGTGAAGPFAILLADKLTRNLNEMGRIKTYRASENKLTSFARLGTSNVTIPLAVRITEIGVMPDIRLSLELVTGDDDVTIWSASQTFRVTDLNQPGSPILNSLVSRAVIEIGNKLQTFTNDLQMVGAGQLIECVYQIFGLSAPDLDRAEQTLSKLLKQNPSAQAYAWMAFAKSFQVGQRYSQDSAAQISEAHYYATRALEEDEFDPLVLSLAAHIHSYLFSEYDLAASLFERALMADPEQTIGWDLYAMLHAYTGQVDQSLKMANWAQHLGSNTPISYYFDTTKCIAASLAGDYKASIEAGERALVQRPKFNSILRYLISSHAHLGNVQMVEALRQRLMEVEPDFSAEVLQGSGYPGLTTEGGRHFLLGLQKAGFEIKKE